MASLRAGVFCIVFALCIWDLAQTVSITKVNSLELPGGEKISKREAPNQPPQAVLVQEAAKNIEEQQKNVKLTKPFGVVELSEERSTGQEQVARHRRAAQSKVEEVEDMDTAANTVFLPQFRKHFRPANRFRREINDEAIENFLSDKGEGRQRRYVREAQNYADDLDVAANTVFLPQFRKRFRQNLRQF